MSLIKVKVVDTTVTNRSGVSKRGKPYSINSQENVFFELNGEVRKNPINLPDGVSAYSAGMYTFDPVSCLIVGRYGFEFDGFKEIKLIPVSSSSLSTVTDSQTETMEPENHKKPLKFG
jgi:hypothetical protein